MPLHLINFSVEGSKYKLKRTVENLLFLATTVSARLFANEVPSFANKENALFGVFSASHMLIY